MVTTRDVFDDAELARIAKEAYSYFVPLVIMDITRAVSTNTTQGFGRGKEPMNVLSHARVFPPGTFRGIVRPNFDTLYSTAWIDVSEEPYVFSIPATPDKRFFMMPLYDMWTEVFASPGTRTNGTEPFSFAVCSPTWRGELPAGVERIDAPTPIVWALGRTETYLEADYPHINAFQDAIIMAPLSSYPHPAPVSSAERDASIDMKTPPLRQLEALGAEEFFARASELIAIHPPHLTDWNMVARLRHLNFHVGQKYDPSAQTPAIQAALRGAPAGAGVEMMERFKAIAPFVNGWRTFTDTTAVWGNFYLKRAMIAMWGLGINPVEETVYPSLQFDENGHGLKGENVYQLHFTEEPPCRAFWSLTVYDPKGFPFPNPDERYALGDRDELVYNDDGSLDVFLSHGRPSAVPFANWLPVPEGPFNVTMRIYWPEDEIFSLGWTPPPARIVS
jgi:hypothetical protein